MLNGYNQKVNILFPKQENVFKSLNQIPGPKSYPFIGSLLTLKGFGGDYNLLEFREFQNILYKQYGDIVKWDLLNEKNVYLYNPEYIKQAFKADGVTPRRSSIMPLLKLNEKLGIRSTLSNSQGERWRKLRSLSNPVMAKPTTINSYLPNQNLVANELVNIIKNKMQLESVLHFKKFDQLLRLLALEYVSEIAFDNRLNCLDETTRLADISRLVKEIDTFFEYAGRLIFSVPIWKLYPTKEWLVFEDSARFILKTVWEYIRKAHDSINDDNYNEKKTVLKEFLERKELYGLDTVDVVGLMTDFIIAGVDTSATAIYYLLIELGLNQDIQEKLYQEIKSVVKPNEDVNEEHLEKLKYLKLVIKESMRLHSTVPANSRILTEDCVIGDYLIPKGTVLVFCNSTITQNDKYFKNASKFDPERWIRDADSIHPYATLSFGFGARMCPGRRVAEQEIYLTIIKLIQNFRIEYLEEKPGLKIGLVASPNKNLNVNLYRRN
nr:cytochrome p450 CYP3047B1 [Brachionus angularis]